MGRSGRVTYRDRMRGRQFCMAVLPLEAEPSVLGLNRHECQLPMSHFGPHLCWCQCTFLLDGTRYYPQPLRDDDGSTWPSPDWTPGPHYGR